MHLFIFLRQYLYPVNPGLCAASVYQKLLSTNKSYEYETSSNKFYKNARFMFHRIFYIRFREFRSFMESF